MSRALLIEIGCEEIPARMIRAAAVDFGERLRGILVDAGFTVDEARTWGGSRRLAARIDGVGDRLADRREQVLGPPASVALDADGRPTKAALGFARKYDVDPAVLGPIETDRGTYAGFEREVPGATLAEVLARDLPAAVAGMTFPKTMRWGDGGVRWVRPVHWVVALHGDAVVPLEVFGVRSGRTSVGHRFLHHGPVELADADAYETALESARVVVDAAVRRARLAAALDAAARSAGGVPVRDEALLDEVADLVEWPGVVAGRFDDAFLDLPRELLVTTLRHHQKCFSVQRDDGGLLPAFLATANTDRDPAGHVRRGNEWVVGGRLDDAAFFWNEDRKRPLAARSERLAAVVFHARAGTYADRAAAMGPLARQLAVAAGHDEATAAAAEQAARWCKADLVTGTVGEFPELQGVIGGLLIRAEGGEAAVADAVYEHYRPEGPDDDVPSSPAGRVVAAADKLDAITRLTAAGERATGSRDPFGLRRAAAGLFRIAIECRWPVSLEALVAAAGGTDEVSEFLVERLRHHLRDRGATANEIEAVLRPGVEGRDTLRLPLHDVAARLAALRGVRERNDFAQLVELTKRVETILVRNEEVFAAAASRAAKDTFVEDHEAAQALAELIERCGAETADLETKGDYDAVVEVLAGFVDPVERFFADVLVIDHERPAAMLARRDLLARLRAIATGCFDIRELAGQAERR